MSETKQAERARADVWGEIERRHLGRCLWQTRPAANCIIEGMEHRATGAVLVVHKTYEDRLPKPGGVRPWPELTGVQVYAPMDAEGQTWDGLDAALRDYAG